jgi:hypothetical protein
MAQCKEASRVHSVDKMSCAECSLYTYEKNDGENPCDCPSCDNYDKEGKS